MSIKIMSHVWEDGPADKAEVLVLLAIADYCNDEGECWPSVASIARKARMTERGVQKICARLCEIGWIEIELRNGRHGCNLYRVNTPNTVHHEPRSPRTRFVQTPNTVRQNPEPRSPKPSLTTIEPSKSNNARDDFAEFWERYPRKIGKAAARKSYDKARKSTHHDDIMFGLSQQIEILSSREQQYIPHPSTWLNQERWNDEPEQRSGQRINGTHSGSHRPGAGMAQAFAAVAERMSRHQSESDGGGDDPF